MARRNSIASTEDAYAALRRAETAIAAGADPYAATGLRFSPSNCILLAHNACVAECPHVLTALIEKYGVDVNGVAEGGWETLLIRAALAGSTKCVAVLLSHGADVNLAAVHKGNPVSPLLVATQRGHVAVCRQLLEAGADMEFRGELQSTALHCAAQWGKVGVVALLMQRGADTRATNSDLFTPIMVACFNQQLLCVQALLPRADLYHRHKYGASLLHVAAEHGGPAVLEVVLPRYVEAGLVDIPSGVAADNMRPAGRTPLMSTCVSARYTEAKMLLQAGASRYLKDSTRLCPLFFCLSGTSMACVQLLLGTAPNWHYTPEQLSDASTDWTMLATAVQSGSADACKLLIAAGADTHAKLLHKGALIGYADLARRWWPDRPELAAVFDPGAMQEPFTPPCCANCQKSGIKLRACSKCHAAQYCSTACQRAHWRAHKPACMSTDDMYAANREKYQKL
jgi:MYND finger/Ankyrin repeats (3 copies)/Ankyrin repeats (many copies)